MPTSSPLALWERQLIARKRKQGTGIRVIARVLGRSPSTISRELARNTTSHGYHPVFAGEIAASRARHTNKRKLDKDPILRAYVLEKLRYGWSPEQIAGRLREHPPKALSGRMVSHEAIYTWVYEGKGSYELLIPHLRHKKRKRKKRRSGRKPQQIPGRVSITERPRVIAARTTVGHWEDDSVIYKDGVLATQYERSLMLTRITRVPDKSAFSHEQALQAKIARDPQGLWKTVTRDNGTENVLHESTKTYYGVKSYFCDPYASWQKGGIENANGLIRDLLPKTTRLRDLPPEAIALTEHLLNTRPRKRLNYLTPNEALERHLKRKRSVAINS
jgi:IS30 family transposase